MSDRRRAGFTLIELLVVIAIIAILAAILFPVFAKAREKARQTSCLSNCKQLGLGLYQYTQDYDEHYPYMPYNGGAGPGLGYMINSYIANQQIWKCPDDSINTGAVNATFTSGVSYAYNEWWIGSSFGGTTPETLAAVQAPATGCALWGAWTPVSWIADNTGTFNRAEGYPVANGGNATTAAAHNNGGNFLFCDGHAKWQPGSDILQAQLNAQANPAVAGLFYSF